jgi:hypothetical protein
MTATLTTPATWELTLPDKIKSLNEIKSGFARHRDTLRWEQVLHAELYYQGIHSPTYPPRQKMRLTITQLLASGERAYDYDGLVGGSKGIVDAIKRLRHIRNDSPAHLESAYLQERVTGRGGTRIRLEPAGGNP